MSKITANSSHRFDDISDSLADAVKIALIEKTVYAVDKNKEVQQQAARGINQVLQQKIQLGKIRYGGDRKSSY
jgi:acid phosphatase class B